MKRSRVLALGAAAVAASAGFGTPLRARAATAVRIATINADAGAEVYYGRDLGYFEKAGLDVEVQNIANGNAVTAAVLGGSIDIGFSNMATTASAHEKGLPLSLIAPGSLYVSTSPTSVLVVPKDSPLKTAKDLNGKTIAISGLRNITEFGPRAWMDANGGDSSTVKFIDTNFGQMIAMLGNHSVDAAVEVDPVLEEAKSVARIFSDCYDAISKRFLIGCYFASNSWIAANTETVKTFARAMRQIAIYANGHQAQTLPILAKAAKMDVAVLAQSKRVIYAERFEPALMQPLIDVSAKYGLLSKAFPGDELVSPVVKG